MKTLSYQMLLMVFYNLEYVCAFALHYYNIVRLMMGIGKKGQRVFD